MCQTKRRRQSVISSCTKLRMTVLQLPQSRSHVPTRCVTAVAGSVKDNRYKKWTMFTSETMLDPT